MTLCNLCTLELLEEKTIKLFGFFYILFYQLFKIKSELTVFFGQEILLTSKESLSDNMEAVKKKFEVVHPF